MKNLMCLFILILGIISCSADDDTGMQDSQWVGKWNWISSCGGFTGGCWYPSEDNYVSLEITENKYIQKRNGVIERATSYSNIDKLINGTNIRYEMKLEDGAKIRFTFIADNLSIEGGDFWEAYERIE
jgi:hypothetical protein